MSSNEAPTGPGSNVATLTVGTAPSVAAIPALSELGALLAALLLAVAGLRRLRQ